MKYKKVTPKAGDRYNIDGPHRVIQKGGWTEIVEIDGALYRSSDNQESLFKILDNHLDTFVIEVEEPTYLKMGELKIGDRVYRTGIDGGGKWRISKGRDWQNDPILRRVFQVSDINNIQLESVLLVDCKTLDIVRVSIHELVNDKEKS